MDEGTLSFEVAAEYRTNISGWVCKTCRRFWAEDERIARWCCADDLKCTGEGCEARVKKGGYTCCDPCRDKKEHARWLALPEVPWDGETPLVLDDDDEYFFSADDLQSYLEEHEHTLDSLRLVIAVPESKPEFNMADHLADYLPDDLDCNDDTKINAVVNRWIEKNAPDVWVPGKTRPTLASMTPLFVRREAE